MVNRYAYRPYGDLISSDEGVSNRLRFAGRHGVQAAPGGQYWVQWRTYDPVMGRFLSPDLAVSEGENPYTYGSNQPSNRVDFTGYDDDGGNALTTANNGVGRTNLAVGTTEMIIVEGAKNANNLAESEYVLAQSRLSDAEEIYADVHDYVEKNGGAAERPNMLKRRLGDVEDASKTLFRAEQTVEESSKALQLAEEGGGKFAKRLGWAGTGLTWATAGKTIGDYGSGDPSVMVSDVVHDVNGIVIDALGYFPPTKPLSLAFTATDIGTQLTFTPIANWWYEPDDPFGPRYAAAGRKRQTELSGCFVL